MSTKYTDSEGDSVEKQSQLGKRYILGNLEEGSSTWDFESWMKVGALRIEHLSLKRLHGGGLRGSSFTADPGICVKKVSRYGHLFSWGALSNREEPGMWGGSSYTREFYE